MKTDSVLTISRAISACKRCRSKKIKCSHDFPRCAACEKANVECVSLDPATGRDVSRSYVVSLENEVEQLRRKLEEATNNIGPIVEIQGSVLDINSTLSNNNKMDASSISMDSFETGKTSSFMENMNTRGVSFSKLMVTALQFKDNRTSGEGEKTPIDPTTATSNLDESGKLKVALLPPKQQALDLLSLYFSQSNSQLPIFHRETFLREYFQPIYGSIPNDSTFASSFTPLNYSMLSEISDTETWYYLHTELFDKEFDKNPKMDVLKYSSNIDVPKKFRKPLYFLNITFAIASSVLHLQFDEEISDNFKSTAMKYTDDAYSSSNRLEVMQAMLIHTLYSLMRPCVPGVWYLLGSTLRMCVDLELHKEEKFPPNISFFETDLRRRLFWCCYSLDRQICVYLNRPFGIPEESIDVEFPSLLDDSFITPNSEETDQIPDGRSSYKYIAIAMFKVRLLQAELQSILHEKKEIPRSFSTFKEWLSDISLRLDIWINSVPETYSQMNCDFNVEFLDLNYDHSRVMLHGLSPVRFDFSDEDMIKLAGASMGMIFSFFSLWEKKSLNHTWAATQNVFMAGTSYLYAIFHNKKIQKQIQFDEVKKISDCVEVVLSSLIDKCNASKECLEVYQILSRAVIKLIFPQTFLPIKSEHMQRLPSEDQIRTLQPGGNLTANMRKLVASIPSLMSNDNLKKRQRSLDEDGSATTKRFNYNLTTESMFAPPKYDLDLDKFFEQVEKSDPDIGNYNPVYMGNQPTTNTPTNIPNDNNQSNVGEGAKVYKMIYETGVDSIWDQYFATPFSGDD